MHLKMNHREISRTSGLQVWQAFRLIKKKNRRNEKPQLNIPWIPRLLLTESHGESVISRSRSLISEISLAFNVMKIGHSFCAAHPPTKKGPQLGGVQHTTAQVAPRQTDLKIWVSRCLPKPKRKSLVFEYHGDVFQGMQTLHVISTTL